MRGRTFDRDGIRRVAFPYLANETSSFVNEQLVSIQTKLMNYYKDTYDPHQSML